MNKCIVCGKDLITGDDFEAGLCSYCKSEGFKSNYYNTNPLSKKEVIDLLKKSEFTVVEPRKKIRILCIEEGSVDEATMESIENGEDLDGKVLIYKGKKPFILEL